MEEYKIEFHSHTYPASKDSLLSPEELVDGIIRAGRQGVVLTNHLDGKVADKGDSLWNRLHSSKEDMEQAVLHYQENYQRWLDDIETAQRYAEAKGVRVYAGIEYELSHSHIFVVGRSLQQWREKPLPLWMNILELRNACRDCLLIQNHPNRFDDNLVPFGTVDGYEVMNTKTKDWDGGIDARETLHNQSSDQYMSKINVVGSDIHCLADIGKSAVAFPKLPEDEAELVSLLKTRQYRCEVTIFDVLGREMG